MQFLLAPRLSKKSRGGNQARLVLSLTEVRDGMNRSDAARIGEMEQQTFRDWVHRFNEEGPDGILDYKATTDRVLRLSSLVEKGPDLEVKGVVRWRAG